MNSAADSLSRNTIKTGCGRRAWWMSYRREVGPSSMITCSGCARRWNWMQGVRGAAAALSCCSCRLKFTPAATAGDWAIRAWRAEAGAVTARSAYVPLVSAVGQGVPVRLERRRPRHWRHLAQIQVAHEALRRGHSGWWSIDAEPRCCSMHTPVAIAALGALPRRGIYDKHVKTAVDRCRGVAEPATHAVCRDDGHCLMPTSATSRPGGKRPGRRTSRMRTGASRGSQLQRWVAELLPAGPAPSWLATRCVATPRTPNRDSPEAEMPSTSGRT